KKMYEPEINIDNSSGFIANESNLEKSNIQEREIEDRRIEDTKIEEKNIHALSEKNNRVPPVYPIGQMHGTYIFAQNEIGCYMMDQQAAQARIKYEYYTEKVGQVSNELQEVLVPLTLEFSTDEYINIIVYKQELEPIGVLLQEFGINSF